MNITGKITKVKDIQKGISKATGKEWQSIEFVIDNNEPFNNIFCFTVFGAEKVENFLKFNKVGQVVKVDFNISTREYDGKHYTTLMAWKVFKADAIETPTAQAPIQEPVDDLPF